MSARHQLAAELSAAAQVEDLAEDILGDPLHYADFVLAAGWRPPAEKGDHEIVWHLDGDMVRGEAVCNLPAGADCRVTCPHECESWDGGRDEQGPYHLAYDSDTDADARHDMVPMPGDECNVTLFLNEDPGWISELHASTQRREIGRIPIAPKWLGDHYEFDVVEGGAA